ncbi:C6 transcription factor [Penicillium angulare]|uniref:C6 transcription factor n=1 Tax=Penicillium angulare TaxID=116970 RepID=UPI002540CED0|nr:C6 transcription factor [Penicillium angulare]KAJ5281097.1 C6 transcription factor [Penicillium angulare]
MSPLSQQPSPTEHSEAPGPMRQRSRQACLPCRRRKRKCDGKMPCNVCKGYDYECEYDNGTQSTAPVKRPSPLNSSSSQPPKRMARLAHSSTTSKQSTDSSILPGVIEPSKPRYVGRYSSIAFPLYVGLEVQATNLPRLHSFAYHTGVRKEPNCAVSHKISGHVPWSTARSLLDVYTAVIHPVFGFLDMDRIYVLSEKHWHEQPQDMAFEALICGILALASLFSDFLNQESETWIVLHAKEILEDVVISRFPTLETIAAWILRTIYIRSTGRPHVAWLCSCTIMHLVEAAGLHHAPEFIMQAIGNLAPNPEITDIINRTAQVANCVHILVAFEYGRSIMTFNRQTIENTDATSRGAGATTQLCNLVATIPTNQGTDDPDVLIPELLSTLDRIITANLDHDFLTLLQADLALGIYRRLRVMEPGLQHGQNDRVISVGTAALSAARRLASQNQPWWNVVGSVFQFACVLIVMDTPASCEKLSEAMDTLQIIVDRFQTHLAREALSTARQLVKAFLDKKRRGVETLERIVGTATPEASDPAGESQLLHDIASLSPSLAAQLPIDLDYLWAMDFQPPI